MAALVVLVGVATAVLTIYTALARKSTGAYLCDDCKFNSPEKCLKIDRPFALVCTSYRTLEPYESVVTPDINIPMAEAVVAMETGTGTVELAPAKSESEGSVIQSSDSATDGERQVEISDSDPSKS